MAPGEPGFAVQLCIDYTDHFPNRCALREILIPASFHHTQHLIRDSVAVPPRGSSSVQHQVCCCNLGHARERWLACENLSGVSGQNHRLRTGRFVPPKRWAQNRTYPWPLREAKSRTQPLVAVPKPGPDPDFDQIGRCQFCPLLVAEVREKMRHRRIQRYGRSRCCRLGYSPRMRDVCELGDKSEQDGG